MSTNEELLRVCEALRCECALGDLVSYLKRDIEKAEAALRERLIKERDGWVLVPKEPTEEMIKAAYVADRYYTDRNFGVETQVVHQGGYDHYFAMLAAAPKE